MEPFFADLLYCKKIPRWIRLLLLWLLCGFLIYIGVGVGLGAVMLAGNIFGFVFAAGILALGIYLSIKIWRGNTPKQ